MISHTEEQHPIDRFTCDECEFTGTSYMSLTHHVRFVHMGKTFDCKQCDYKTPYSQNVRIHMERVHCKEPPVECDWPLCDFQCNKLNLMDHKARIHKPCKICGYEPQSVSDKSAHKTSHKYK